MTTKLFYEQTVQTPDIKKYNKVSISDNEDNAELPNIPSQQIYFEFGRSISTFVGRTKEINDIRNMYNDITTSLVTIVGMGGVGKSELVKKIGRLFHKECNANSIWLNAETPDSFKNSLIRLTENRRIVQNKRQSICLQKNLLRNIVDLLSKAKRRTVFIVDNLDKSNGIVTQFLLQTENTKFFVIGTSRSVDVLDCAKKVLKLEVLNRQESKELLSKAITDHLDEDLDRLCKLIGDFPLALQQAIAFINRERLSGLIGESYNIRDYVQDYEKHSKKLLNFSLNQHEHDYDQTTYVTWNISIDKIKSYGQLGSLAVAILNCVAYLEADNIPIDLICRLVVPTVNVNPQDFESFSRIYRVIKNIAGLFGGLNSLSKVKTAECATHEEAVALVKAYSLFKVENNKISIHRLVQEVLRTNLEPNDQVLRSLLSSINNKVETIDPLELVHVLSMWKYGRKNSKFVTYFRNFSFLLTERLRELNLYSEMYQVALDSIKELEDNLGKDSIEARRMRRQVGEALYCLDELQPAIDIWTKEYHNLIAALGTESSETIATFKRIKQVSKILNKPNDHKLTGKRIKTSYLVKTLFI